MSASIDAVSAAIDWTHIGERARDPGLLSDAKAERAAREWCRGRAMSGGAVADVVKAFVRHARASVAMLPTFLACDEHDRKHALGNHGRYGSCTCHAHDPLPASALTTVSP